MNHKSPGRKKTSGMPEGRLQISVKKPCLLYLVALHGTAITLAEADDALKYPFGTTTLRYRKAVVHLFDQASVRRLAMLEQFHYDSDLIGGSPDGA